jgi:hypothetical protein
VNDNHCPACLGANFKLDDPDDADYCSVSCQRCGRFYVHESALYQLQDEGTPLGASRFGTSTSRKRANLSGYLRENQGMKIDKQDLERLANLKTPAFHERADKLLRALDRETKAAGETVDYQGPAWLAIAWCVHEGELAEVVGFLETSHRIRRRFSDKPGPVAIEPDGWAHLEQLRERGAATSQGFIAMNMAESTDSLTSLYHQGLEAGIEAAGYKPLRIDRKLDTDKLDDEILAEIRRSKFLVADLTGHRQSVYLELGFALGLGMRAFRTCRADQVKDVAFDQRTYLCMTWEEGGEHELAKTLADRIVARLGPGPNKPPN